MSRVFIWRHGQTEWNAQRRFQGQSDPPLNAAGLLQADEAAALLSTFAPDLILTSDLQRAAQTAAALGAATGLAPHADIRLRERSLGHWEGLTRDEVEVAHPDEFADWAAGREVARRGGETREQVAARAMELFSSLPPARTIVLVTHSATALALTGALLELEHSRHVLGPLANCHWSELQSHDGAFRLRAHNAGPAGSIIPRPADEGDSTDSDSPDAEALDAAGR